MKKHITKFLLFCIIVFTTFNCIMVNASAKTQELDVVYFYSSKCMACKENRGFIDEISALSNVNLIKYNTDEDDYSDIQYAYAQHYHVPDEDSLMVPMIYFADKHYELKPENHNQVKSEILAFSTGEQAFTNFEYKHNGTNAFEELMRKMTIPGILLAGLIDGINPCAISMLMVFYSFLLMTEDKKKIIGMSATFIAGIFMANFIFGLGIKYFYNAFAGNAIVAYCLYGIAIAMCLFAIALNTLDIINHHRNVEAKNQLPDKIKFKLSNVLRNSVFSKFAIATALVVGFIIGVVELACTGQIYFPTLTYMIQNTNYGVQSIMLLVGYNIMFVLPLIVITVIAGVVKQPEQIKNIIMKRNWIIKLIANIFFVVMSIILIRQMIQF